MTFWEFLNIFNLAPLLKKLYVHFQKRRSRKSWSEVLRMLEDLYTQMNSEPFHPDVVVGIDREGSIVASIFAFNWRLKPYCALERKFVSKDVSTVVEIVDTVSPHIIKDRKVLLIDSEVNSGQTMKTAKEFILKEKSASIVRTMALGRSITSTFRPNYVAFDYAERPYWPWEYTKEIKLVRHKYHFKEHRHEE